MTPPIENPKSRLNQLGAAARKSASQNFLKDPAIAHLLVESALAAPDAQVIWEVGPGLGALTELVIKRAQVPVRLFEIDRKLAADLRRRFPTTPLEEGDFLKAPLDTFDVGKRITLVSNLPYAISSQVLFRIGEYRERFSQAVLTFQKEFADRLSAQPRTKDYAALTVIVQLTFAVRSLGRIPAQAFYPAPKIESEALLFTPLPAFDPGVEVVAPLVKTAFMHRRKKLSSNLSGVYGKERVQSAFATLNLSDNTRAEELSPADFVRLTKLLT